MKKTWRFIAGYKGLMTRIRHSLDVRVLTSARQTGRATGGLSELLETLSHNSLERQPVFVELPEVSEARINCS